jgi:hypothetical protein
MINKGAHLFRLQHLPSLFPIEKPGGLDHSAASVDDHLVPHVGTSPPSSLDHGLSKTHIHEEGLSEQGEMPADGNTLGSKSTLIGRK